MTLRIKKSFNIAMHSTYEGKFTACLFVAGFFYACTPINGSVPPCGALMCPLPSGWNATGKAEPLFNFCHQQTIFTVMHSTENNCLNANASNVQATAAHETGNLYSRLTPEEQQLFTNLLIMNPGIRCLRLYFKRSGVIITGYLERHRRFVIGQGSTFKTSYQDLTACIEYKLSLPPVPKKKQIKNK